MRRYVSKIFIIIMMAVMLSGCVNNDSKVNQTIQEQMQKVDNENDQNALSNPTATPEEPTKGTSSKPIDDNNLSENLTSVNADIDLTKLSSTMVYAEVYNMMCVPGDYIGKNIKVSGEFVAYTSQSQFYPAVIIADATVCCTQGLEFILEGNPSYPDGYPELGTEITVVGTFETYEEDGNTYCRLKNAKIE